MNSIIKFSSSLLLGVMLIGFAVSAPVFAGGGGKTPPVVDSPTFADVTATTATLGGTAQTEGSLPLTDSGINWGTSSAPEATLPNTVSGGGTCGGAIPCTFTVPVTGLPSNTTIFFRAWAINGDGRTGYTAETTFTTAGGAAPPTLDASTLDALVNVTSSTAPLGGSITSDGGDLITQHGTVWNTGGTPVTPTDNPSTLGSLPTIPPTHVFTTDTRTGLPTGTLIHFRSYATNTAGTGYGPNNSFYTEPAASPASVIIDQVGDTSFRVNWPANPAGDGDGALVVVSENTITATPTDGAEHTFNSVFATGGTDIGTLEYVVYRGTGATNVTVTGLTNSSSYNVAVFYSAGVGGGETGINYRQTSPGTASQATNTPASPPTIDTPTFGTVTTNSVVLGGWVRADGGAAITERGTVWGLAADPDIVAQAANVNVVAGTLGEFSGTVNGLPAGTLIHFRAYATNSAGTSYTADTTFTTSVGLPTVTIDPATPLSATSAIFNGEVTADGGATVTGRGTVWGTTPNPTGNALSAGSGPGTFSHERTGLPAGTLVYYRAYATNSAGTAYSADRSFVPKGPPTMLAAPPVALNITHNSADLGGEITSDGGSPILERGTVWNTAGSPTITDNKLAEGGTVVEAFSHNRSGFPAGTTIFYRSYATNSVGTGLSANHQSFVTTTEPNIQASNAAFPMVSATAMRISWTRGNGDGSIVVFREQVDSRVDPLDGDDYVANPEIGVAPNLNNDSKSHVIYKGNAAFTNVFGLTASTNYCVAIYEFTDAGPDYLQTTPAEACTTTTNKVVHNMAFGADCGDCHSHAGPDGAPAEFVPTNTNQEAVCITCHNPSGPASAATAFGLHRNPSDNPDIDFVDCGYCHELHNPDGDNTTTSTHPVTLATQDNLAFIRANVDKYVPTAATPLVYHTDPDDRAIEGGDDTTARALCQACHTLTTYHTNNPSVSASNQCHEGDSQTCPGPPPQNNGDVNCGSCHAHDNNFTGVGGSQTCLQCHAGSQPPERDPIVPQFSLNSTHIDPAQLTELDCEVCHDFGTHNDTFQVTVFDMDDNGTTYAMAPHANLTTDGAGEPVVNHCLSCHDSDGASDPANSFVQTPLLPFTGTTRNPPIIDSVAWATAAHNRPVATSGSSPVTCLGGGTNGCHSSGHGSEENNLLAPVPSAEGGNDGAADNPEVFCLRCHDSDGPSAFDISADFAGATKDAISDFGAAINQRHDVLASDQGRTAISPDGKNTAVSDGVITCGGCHDPHTTPPGDPGANPPTPPVVVPGTGAALVNYNASNYGGGVDPTFGVAEIDYIPYCLACHDNDTTGIPGVTMPTGDGTNTLVDIATSWLSGGNDQHGVLSGGSSGNAPLKAPFTEDAATAALNCTTCHGAHGTANIFNLKTSIKVGNTDMMVGNGHSGDMVLADNTARTTYELPYMDGKNVSTPGAGGRQTNFYWGGWCSFCHQMNHKKDEGTPCDGGHMHAGSKF